MSVIDVTAVTEFVTLRLANQLLGIPVLMVQDVLKLQKITRVPGSPSWIAGVLNLRGKIVTAIDLRERLGLKPRAVSTSDIANRAATMSIVVEHGGEPYSLRIDSVGEVLRLYPDQYEKNPVTMDGIWRDVSAGVYRLEKELLIVLDIHRLLDFDNAKAA